MLLVLMLLLCQVLLLLPAVRTVADFLHVVSDVRGDVVQGRGEAVVLDVGAVLADGRAGRLRDEQAADAEPGVSSKLRAVTQVLTDPLTPPPPPHTRIGWTWCPSLVDCTHPAAQFPCAIPDMSEHSVLVKQVPFLLTPFLTKKNNNKRSNIHLYKCVNALFTYPVDADDAHGSFWNVTMLNNENTESGKETS